MNKTTTVAQQNPPPSPKVGFTVHVPFETRQAIHDAAYKGRVSVNKWVIAAINAKLEANGK